MRLNLGSAEFPLAGFLNVDLRPCEGVGLVADALHLPFEDSSIDEVYSGHLLEHVADPARALNEWRRVLRRGGRLTVTVPDFTGASMLHSSGRSQEAEIVAFGLRELTFHRVGFSGPLLHSLFRYAGFADVRELADSNLLYHSTCDEPWQIIVSGKRP